MIYALIFFSVLVWYRHTRNNDYVLRHCSCGDVLYIREQWVAVCPKCKMVVIG